MNVWLDFAIKSGWLPIYTGIVCVTRHTVWWQSTAKPVARTFSHIRWNFCTFWKVKYVNKIKQTSKKRHTKYIQTRCPLCIYMHTQALTLYKGLSSECSDQHDTAMLREPLRSPTALIQHSMAPSKHLAHVLHRSAQRWDGARHGLMPPAATSISQCK